MSTKLNSDQSFLNDAAVIVERIAEEQSIRNQRIQSDFISESVRLQNLSIFSGLKKTTEELDGKLCLICKKNQKEILWWANQQVLRLLPLQQLHRQAAPRPAKPEAAGEGLPGVRGQLHQAGGLQPVHRSAEDLERRAREPEGKPEPDRPQHQE